MLTPNYQYFLVAAEELNISRAAKRLNVTQQCLSSFIQRLEKETGALLFNRKPRLTLTASGEILQRYYKKLQLLENSLAAELNEVQSIDSGEVNIGLHVSRSRFLMPLFTKRYPELCQRIHLNIFDGLTSEFEQMLASGQIDFFIGLNPSYDSSLVQYLLLRESVYLVISETLLRRFFGSEGMQRVPEFEKGVELREFAKVPFIINHQSSNLTKSINYSLEQEGLKLKSILSVNGNDMHMELSRNGLGACFIPQMFLPMADRFNKDADAESRIYAFPVNDFVMQNRLCLAHSRELFLTKTLKSVIAAWKTLFAEVFGGVSKSQ